MKKTNWYVIIVYRRNWSGHHSNYSPLTSFYPYHVSCSLSTREKYHGRQPSKKDPQIKCPTFLGEVGEGGGGSKREREAQAEKNQREKEIKEPPEPPIHQQTSPPNISLLKLILNLTFQYLSLLNNNMPLVLPLECQ